MQQGIMQNKPNFLNNQMSISLVMTKFYGNFHHLGRCKNKPKTKPIKPNLKNAKMNLSSVKTKDYRNEPPLRPPAKQTQFKPNQTQFHQHRQPLNQAANCGNLKMVGVL